MERAEVDCSAKLRFSRGTHEADAFSMGDTLNPWVADRIEPVMRTLRSIGLSKRSLVRAPEVPLVRPGWYCQLLSWSFTLFNTVRVLAYLPTYWAVHQSGDSSQHSLWTWLGWFGANLTTVAWLYEKDGHRMGRVAIASAANAAMCLAISAPIVWYRL